MCQVTCGKDALLRSASPTNHLTPPLGTPAALTPEQRLVHPHSLYRSKAVGVGFEQRFTPSGDFFVDRMPITAQLGGYVLDRPAEPTDLGGRPPRRPRRQQPRSGAMAGPCSMNDRTPQVW